MAAEYRALQPQELTRALFRDFDRRQPVDLCWRRDASGGWEIRPDPFVDDWSEQDYTDLLAQLQAAAGQGGLVLGAFVGASLKGFASVEPDFLGPDNAMLELSNLHVSRDFRGRGLGKALFRRACQWAKAQGAAVLYLSAHSAAETQAFYRSLGCVDARWISLPHVAREPFDCQMEYPL